jgi:hypothetical protein
MLHRPFQIILLNKNNNDSRHAGAKKAAHADLCINIIHTRHYYTNYRKKAKHTNPIKTN